MSATTRRLALTALAVTAFAASAAPVRADDDDPDPYGIIAANDFTTDVNVYVANRTGVTITYQVRWGDGPWKKYALAPGKGRVHTDIVYGMNPKLEPVIAYDDFRNSGHRHKLLGSECKNKADLGTRYAFKPTADGENFLLYKVAR